MILQTLACVALCGAGHLVRDGEPSFKRMLGPKMGWLYHLSTQLARVSGAAICGLGAYTLDYSMWSIATGAAVLTGFYADMKHGDGQGAAALQDAGWLALSGVTSLAPLAALEAFLHGPLFALVVLLGLLKPTMWFFWNWVKPDRVLGGSWYFTRFAAVTFGLLVGAIIALS